MIRTLPEKNVYINQNVTLKILGYPVIAEDIIEEKVLYERANNMNID